jgi:hypothetical protein
MKKTFVFILLISSILSYSSVSAQDKNADAQKLYLQANSLIQQENYKAAKTLLEKLILDYSDFDIAKDADKKLSEILPKLPIAGLPKVPGVYAKLKSSELVKLETEPIITGNMINSGAYNHNDLVNPPEVQYVLFTAYKELTTDELESFIIFSPKQSSMLNVNMYYANPIKKGARRWIKEAEGSKGKTKFVLKSFWSDNTTNGKTLESDEIIKSKLAENIYELKFPEELTPTYSLFAINDGLGNAYPFLLKQSNAIKHHKKNK